MVKKVIAGLAISIGAGLALQATQKVKRKGTCRPAKSGEPMTPVTIRVHTAASRTTDAIRNADRAPDRAPDRATELAELRMTIDALDRRGGEMLTSVNQRIDDLQNHLPRFIDVKVSSRIREMEERLRTEFQDEQSKTLDAFLLTLETKVLPRLSMVEEAIGEQGEELGRMRLRMDTTDNAINRVVGRIEEMVDTLSPSIHEYANSHVRQFTQKAVA